MKTTLGHPKGTSQNSSVNKVCSIVQPENVGSKKCAITKNYLEFEYNFIDNCFNSRLSHNIYTVSDLISRAKKASALILAEELPPLRELKEKFQHLIASLISEHDALSVCADNDFLGK
jgi:hypothetical protein